MCYGGNRKCKVHLFRSVLARGSGRRMFFFGTFDGSSGDDELKIGVNVELYLLQKLYGFARGESI